MVRSKFNDETTIQTGETAVSTSNPTSQRARMEGYNKRFGDRILQEDIFKLPPRFNGPDKPPPEQFTPDGS